MIERGNSMKPRTEPKVFCGLLRCGTCGMMVTAENKTKVCKDSIHHYTYYRCTKKSRVMKCSEIAVRQEVLDQQFSEILSNYAMPSPWAKEFGLLMDEDRRKGSFESSKIVVDLQNRVYGLSEKIQRLLDVYLAQDIDRETYLKERSKLFSEKKSFEEKMYKLEDATSWLEPMRDWLKTVENLDEIAKRNDLSSKKSHLQKIFGSNLFLHDKKIKENPSSPYAALRAALLRLRNSASDGQENFSPFQTSFIRATELGFEPR
jgi:site-specific DNA recombinase